MKLKTSVLIIVLLGLVVYGGSVLNGFLWDDEEQVVNNGAVHSIGNIPKLFLGSTFNTGGSGSLSGMYYKPMMSVFFALIYSIFGSRAFFFHLVQVGLFITNGVLVYLVFEKLIKNIERDRKSEEQLLGVRPFVALIFALIFLVHPINVETAVYISALQDVLYFLFGMIAFYLVLDEKENKWRYWQVGILLLLSILSKETGVLFLPVMAFYLFYIKRDKKDLGKFINVGFLLAVIYSVMRFGIAGVFGTKEGLSPIMRVSLGTRMISVPKIVYYYLVNIFWPKNLAIAQHWVVNELDFTSFWWPLIFNFLVAILLVVGGMMIWKKKREIFRYYLFFGLWFLVGTGLHLHIIALDMTVADRWFYFGIAGFLGMLMLIFYVLNRRVLVGKYYLFGAGIVIMVLGIRSIIRIGDWKNGLRLFSHDIEISKDAFDLENNLGVELFRVGRLEEAKVHFEKSTKLAPYWWSNWNNLGVIYERGGDLVKAEELYKRAVDTSDYYLAFQNYVGILVKQGKYGEAKEFLETNGLLKFPYNQHLVNAWKYLKIREVQEKSDK
jgi:hypothetical protein